MNMSFDPIKILPSRDKYYNQVVRYMYVSYESVTGMIRFASCV